MMTTKEYNQMMSKFRFDDYIIANALKVAKKRGKMSWLTEIQQAGYEGLARALNNYDYNKSDDDKTFVSYVTTTIDGYQTMVIDYWSNMVRIPKREIYKPNRDSINQELYDITNSQYEQNDEETDGIDCVDPEIMEMAIDLTYKQFTKEYKGEEKAKAHHIYYYEHNTTRSKEPTIKEKISNELNINYGTAAKARPKINKLIKENYDRLNNI